MKTKRILYDQIVEQVKKMVLQFFEGEDEANQKLNGDRGSEIDK